MLGRSGVLAGLSIFALAIVQAILAACTARLLGSPRWWIAIHFIFVPSIAVAAAAQLPAWFYGVFFFVLLGVYWTTFRTQVPLFLSNRITVHRLATWLPDRKELSVLDIGSGTGTFVHYLGLLRPTWKIAGIESAPIPFWLSRRLTRQQENVSLSQGDFWKHSLRAYNVVYAFLSPVPMPDLWRKASKEMQKGSWLISNSFPIPNLKPNTRVVVDDGRESVLFCYQIGHTTGLSGGSHDNAALDSLRGPRSIPKVRT